PSLEPRPVKKKRSLKVAARMHLFLTAVVILSHVQCSAKGSRAQCSWRIAASHSSSIRSFFQLFPYPLNPRYNSVHGRRTRSPAVAGTDQRHPKATPFFRRGWTRAMWSRSPPTHLAGLFAQIRFDPELLVLGVLLIVA